MSNKLNKIGLKQLNPYISKNKRLKNKLIPKFTKKLRYQKHI